MGLADRDYLRDKDSRGGMSTGWPAGGRGGWSGRGRRSSLFGIFSFNTWLIVVNIAVFLLAGLLAGTPNLQRDVVHARAFHRDVPDPWREQARPDLRQRLPAPGMPGLFGRELLVVVPGATLGLPTQSPVNVTVGFEYFQVMGILEYWGHFSTERAFWGLEVWRFITFQFLHANITHLLLNLLALWIIGGLVEEYLGRKRYAAYYLVCGVFGALLYLILNLAGNFAVHLATPPTWMRFLLFDSMATPLVGASAGIFGVLVAAAVVAPHVVVYVLGIIPARMRTVAMVLLAISIFNLARGSANAGGEAAHIGGAIAGWFFIRRMHLLRDFFDVLGNSRSTKPSSVAPRAQRRRSLADPEEQEIDRILAKIKSEGVSSLTDEERRALARRSGAPGAEPSTRVD
jgi:membrane associated rhomboid family serine protease